MQPFIETGGIRVGNNAFFAVNATVPFASLSANNEELNLSGLGKNYLFRKNDNFKLVEYKGIFSKGIKFEHSNPKYPRLLVFWTFRFDEVKRNLETLGYEVN